MKAAVILIVGAGALAVSGLYFGHLHSLRQETQMKALRSELEQKSARIDEMQDAVQRSEKEQTELARRAEELASRVQEKASAETQAIVPPPAQPVAATIKAEPAAVEKQAGGFGKLIDQMMRDPAAKKLIRDQQRIVIDQLYAPLVRKMGFNSEEAGQFKNLLGDNLANATERAFSMSTEIGKTNRAERLVALVGDQKTFDEQIKEFLGADRYSQFQDYQQTVNERSQLNQFKQQTAGGEHPLTEEQTEQLLEIMKAEKQTVAATTGLPLGDAGKTGAGIQALLGDGKFDQLLQAQETISQRVLERAPGVLSPEQLGTFAQFQTNQLQMMRVGMTMARKMFSATEAGDSDAEAK